MANLFFAPTDHRGMVLGDKVEFETPRGDIVSGTCVKKGDFIFAIPEGGQQPHQEEACSSKIESNGDYASDVIGLLPNMEQPFFTQLYWFSIIRAFELE